MSKHPVEGFREFSELVVGIDLEFQIGFAVGDFITAGGVTGTVEDIDIFVTCIKTLDNVRNIIPNAKLYSGVIGDS